MLARRHTYLAKQALLNNLPFAENLRSLKRSVNKYQPEPWNINATLADLGTLHTLMRRSGHPIKGVVLEIGTGWFPISGIIARLCGAEEVILTDIRRYMDDNTFRIARDIVLDRMDEIVHGFDLDADGSKTLLKTADTLQDLRMTYRAPFRFGDIPDKSVDIVMSRACLEHIKPENLETIMRDSRRILKRDGISAHAIDNSDHLSHFDKTISSIQFLERSERRHRLLWNLTKTGENRLRHSQYGQLFQACGYDIKDQLARVHQKAVSDYPRLALTAPFDRLDRDDVCSLDSCFILSARIEA